MNAENMGAVASETGQGLMRSNLHRTDHECLQAVMPALFSLDSRVCSCGKGLLSAIPLYVLTLKFLCATALI